MQTTRVALIIRGCERTYSSQLEPPSLPQLVVDQNGMEK